MIVRSGAPEGETLAWGEGLYEFSLDRFYRKSMWDETFMREEIYFADRRFVSVDVSSASVRVFRNVKNDLSFAIAFGKKRKISRYIGRPI